MPPDQWPIHQQCRTKMINCQTIWLWIVTFVFFTYIEQYWNSGSGNYMGKLCGIHLAFWMSTLICMHTKSEINWWGIFPSHNERHSFVINGTHTSFALEITGRRWLSWERNLEKFNSEILSRLDGNWWLGSNTQLIQLKNPGSNPGSAGRYVPLMTPVEEKLESGSRQV